LSLAYSAGELTAREFADELRRVREREVEQDLEDLRAATTHERDLERRRWEAEREDRLRQHDDEARRALWAREDRQQALEIEARRA
ncbi:hypothetical protein K7G98_41065, partial [Saccharothrix sp. MB29]|nr:hypothetical protein [Saccharothrix sp. MB29]